MDIGRIVQCLLLAAIVVIIGGSLLCEFYVAPRYRQWRVQRRHHNAATMLAAYRSLRRKLRERRLAQVLQIIAQVVDEDPKVMVAPDGKVIVVAAEAVLPVTWGENN